MHCTNFPAGGFKLDVAIFDELDEMERKASYKPVKPFPCIGQTVMIRHQVKRTPAGEVLGIQRADGKPQAAKITAVFLDGSVRTGISDIWEVKPGTVGQWETVNPFVERG